MSSTATVSSELPAKVDTEALRTLLDGRWASVRADVRAQLGQRRLHPDPDWTTEQHRAYITDLARELAASGHTALGFTSEHGGEDDIGGSVNSISMLAYADLSLMVKAGVQWGLFGGAVQALGTDAHHRKYLPAIMSFELPGCFAMTETGHGSNVAAAETTATYDVAAGEFVVHSPTPSARKDYIGNAARDGRLAVVFAQLITPAGGHGVHALLVPIRDADGRPCPGVTISDCGRKAGLNGVDNGRLVFDSVRVPREALLNKYGDVAPDGTYSSPIENESARFFTMLGTLVRGRISVAGSAASATQSALTIAVRYGQRRRQFEAPGREGEIVLLDYLGHQRKLLPALAKSYALHFAQEELVRMLHEVQSGGTRDEAAQRELEGLAAGMKAVTTWHATHAIQACREACGGAGYLVENLLPQLKADTDVFTTFEGDNTVLLQLVAKGLLTEYRDHVGDLNTLGMIKFITEQVVDTIAERTAARGLAQRFKDPAPDDAEWHHELLADREEHLLAGLARRLRRAGEPDADAFAVFNAAQDHLLSAASAHVDRWVLDGFTAGLARCDDDGVTALLTKVRALYALSVVEADRGWFLEHGRLTASQAKAVTATVNELCAELRPYADTLVDGFGIPDAWVDAVILR
ncbi:MAG: acyl-CoA oxidase [Pseudonocardiales bacterium]|jgi:acyl-CoA oxidase|nr:acyl-CoA oxidase [Pseudonocardiales bacterium]MDT7623203.1 acyl-CoA oxidase [Pseudonocardiales bacterium]MDT7632641.1 acyl-CoA oxidase [Pseudonocardiales bacterium]MDT7772129.1 acyl-CoA oxidase [Pseudonocardiales bacterium]